MEEIEDNYIPLEVLITLCARSFLSGGSLQDIDAVSLTQIKDQIEIEIQRRKATYH